MNAAAHVASGSGQVRRARLDQAPLARESSLTRR
jgi:hypothetical protein